MNTKLLISFVFLFGSAVLAQLVRAADSPTPASSLVEIFDEGLLPGCTWAQDVGDKVTRKDGGFAGDRWIYISRQPKTASLQGISFKIREKPVSGEYRFLTFAWRKWGGGQLALQLIPANDDKPTARAQESGYQYDAGSGAPVDGHATRLRVTEDWTEVTRDLWQDFGDFTLTGVSLKNLGGRDAGFDHIYLAQTMDDFNRTILPRRQIEQAQHANETSNVESMTEVPPRPVAAPLDQPAATPTTSITATDTPDPAHETATPKTGMLVNLGQQLKHAGTTGLVQLALSIFGAGFVFERLYHLRQKNLAPVGLARHAKSLWSAGKFDELEMLKETHPSTLARVISFIAANRQSSLNEVSEIAGELVSRELAIHYQRAYPLGIVATLAPLLGLLGMILGMIETFQIVAMAGSLGDPTQLASGISEALVTTALGLAIAIPFLSLFHIFKYRTTNFGIQLEAQVTSLITAWFMKGKPESAPVEEALV